MRALACSGVQRPQPHDDDTSSRSGGSTSSSASILAASSAADGTGPFTSAMPAMISIEAGVGALEVDPVDAAVELLQHRQQRVQILLLRERAPSHVTETEVDGPTQAAHAAERKQ